MSRKLATIIKDSKVPGKWKRVLEAYAAFANNDGSNIYPAQGKLAKKASCSVDTVGRNTPDLIDSGILRRAEKHTCKVKGCNGGSTHYCGHNGKWTNAYEIVMDNLQNAVNRLSAICDKANAAKCRKPQSAKCGTDSGIKETPALCATTLGKNQDSSVVSTTVIDQPIYQSPRPAEVEVTNSEPQGLEAEERQNQTPIRSRTWEMPVSGSVYTYNKLWVYMQHCWSAFKINEPSDQEVLLFAEIMNKCDDNECFPDIVMEYAKTHIGSNPKTQKLWGALQSVRGLHNALCGSGVSTTNGLMAQYKDHRDPNDCHICLKKVQGIVCKGHGCKTWVSLNSDGTPMEYCSSCMNKIPYYRRESGQRSILGTGDI